MEGDGEDGLDGGWSREERGEPTEEHFPSCWRCFCGLREDNGVGVRAPVGLLTGSRLGRVGVLGAGVEEGAK